MGHTSIAFSEADDRIHELTMRFFSGMNYSGPASLELKTGGNGEHWVIEPTVGRTDFWVGMCIADGVDFPVIEYQQTVGRPRASNRQSNTTLWINGDRDPGGILWLLMTAPRKVIRMKITGVYYSAADLRPFFAYLLIYVRALPGRFVRKLKKLSSVSAA